MDEERSMIREETCLISPANSVPTRVRMEVINEASSSRIAFVRERISVFTSAVTSLKTALTNLTTTWLKRWVSSGC